MGGGSKVFSRTDLSDVCIKGWMNYGKLAVNSNKLNYYCFISKKLAL